MVVGDPAHEREREVHTLRRDRLHRLSRQERTDLGARISYRCGNGKRGEEAQDRGLPSAQKPIARARPSSKCSSTVNTTASTMFSAVQTAT